MLENAGRLFTPGRRGAYFCDKQFLGTGFEELRSWLEDFGGQGGML